MKTPEYSFIKFAEEIALVSEEQASAFMHHLDFFSSIATESFYALDIRREQFSSFKPDDLSLCGSYPRNIFPGDLPLWTTMCRAVVQYLNDFKEECDKIDHFSCTFRLQRKFSFISRLFPQMTHHRMKPVWENGELYYLICSVGNSTIKETGNLCMYHTERSTYKEYNLTAKCWEEQTKISLSERKKAILILAGQGKSSAEIADTLCKGHNTIRNQIKVIFSKLKVHSMQEALDVARHHRIL